MRSMTGFGHVEKTAGDMKITVDVKTVNGRFLDLNVRLPREFMAYEAELRATVQKALARGRVDIYVTGTPVSGQQDLNEAVLAGYLTIGSKLQGRGIAGSLDVSTLLQLPGIIGVPEVDYASEGIAQCLLTAVDEALRQVAQGRSVEGAALKRDLQDRVDALNRMVRAVEGRGNDIRKHHQERLRARLQEVCDDRTVDENRLVQELIYYAERSDISEETTRLKAHLERFGHFLNLDSNEAAGKQLDFLCQEMNREVNTILSKSPLAEISQVGIEAKAEIEKIREQVQNVE